MDLTFKKKNITSETPTFKERFKNFFGFGKKPVPVKSTGPGRFTLITPEYVRLSNQVRKDIKDRRFFRELKAFGDRLENDAFMEKVMANRSK